MGAEDSKEIKYKYKDRPTTQEEEELKNKNETDNNNFERKFKNSHDNNIKNELSISGNSNITVKIPLIIGFWEKDYNINTALNQIAIDFKAENGMNSLQKNFFIEFSFKNNPIKMDQTPLKSLINEDILLNKTIHIVQKIKPVPGTENLEEISDVVGKPFSEPFMIYTFEPKTKIIKPFLFNAEKIKKCELDKFGIDSAYCNGDNHLFISGGLDQATNEAIGLFWVVDLKKMIFNYPIQMYPKKNHSMIYIDKKVYIVGGCDVQSMIYDVENRQIKRWCNLNYERFEPSLIKHDNFLFCFDTSKKNNFENGFNFERINLDSDNTRVWELITPKCSPENLNSVFCQKFFGVVEDFKQNIIFIGGMYDDNKENENADNEKMNMQYNITENKIEKSDNPFKDICFSEKCFLPLDYNTYYIIPNFNKRSPKIIYYYKNRNLIDFNSYHSTHRLKGKNSKVKTATIKQYFEGLELDMPNQNEESEMNSNKDNNITSNFIVNPEKIRENLNVSSTSHYNTVNNINEKHDAIQENLTVKMDTFNDNQIEPKITKDSNKPKTTKDSNKQEIVQDREEDKKTNEEIPKTEEVEQNQEKIEEPKNENQNNVSNNASKDEIKSLKQESNNQNQIEEKKEKQIIYTNKNAIKILSFENIKPLEKYHSSLDFRHKNINYNALKKRNKMRTIVLPKKINQKSLKKMVRKINKTEFNEFEENSNY